MSNALATTTTNNTTQSAARIKKAPAARDFEIYKRVKIQGFLQWEVAHDNQLHYSRVSQIIKRVEKWLASGGDPIDPQIRDHADRQRLALGTHKMRLARGIEIASMALEFNEPVKTTRRRVQGESEVWREETSREVPKVNLGALRMLIDATQALHQLEQQEQAAAAQSTDRELLCKVFDLLCTWRKRAEAQDTVRRVTDIPALVSDILFKLLGPQIADLGDRMLRISQEAFLKPQAPVLTAQAPIPTAQETLNLSPSPEASLDATATSSTTSASTPEKSTSPLEPSTPARSASEGSDHATQLPARPSSDILNTSPALPHSPPLPTDYCPLTPS